MNTSVAYVEIDLKEVLNYYIRGYSFSDGRQLIGSESFIDPTKEKVIFKLFIENNNN